MVTGRLLVLGAGIQGACVALAAAHSGHSVALVDQTDQCMQRTSLRNEGKIHLGYVYANDGGFKTASLMARAAFCFAPLLEKWLPERPCWEALRSNPFRYVVARDSLVGADRLYEHYARVEQRCRELMSSDAELHYVGQRPARLWSACDIPPQLSANFASAVVSTPEISVDLTRLRQQIAAALERHPHIELYYGHRVQEAARMSYGFAACGRTSAGTRWQLDADCLVNCLWDSRLTIDAQLGLKPARSWVYRLKHRITGRAPASLAAMPSITIVLGAYGDVVTWPADDSLYLSWYPTCMSGWSQDLAPPESWEAAASGLLPSSRQESIRRDTMAQVEQVIPGIAGIRQPVVDGGTIFSWGDTDIDDTDSELHQRHEIGVTATDGYFSINTGKLTTAPYFAWQLSELLA